MYKILQYFVFLFVVVSCSSTLSSSDSQSVNNEIPYMLTVKSDNLTKTTLSGNNVFWTANDRLSLFTESSANNKYLIHQENSDNSATASFCLEAMGEPSVVLLDKNYVVYPYRETDNSVSAAGVVTTLIKTNQNATEDKILICAPMVAVSDNYEFHLRNVASILRFNIKTDNAYEGACILNRIDVISASKVLSGKMCINTQDSIWTATPLPTSTNQTVCLYGGGINTELNGTSKSFCVVIPPAAYPAGDLTFKITFIDDVGQTEVRTIEYPSSLTLMPDRIQDINITLVPDSDSINVITGGIYNVNNNPHLTCYTASVIGSVSDNVTEIGVLYQRASNNDSTSSLLTIENVGTLGGSDREATSSNYIKREVSESSDVGNHVVRLTNLAGGDVASNYIYRFYAIVNDTPVYGGVLSFRTDTYGQYVSVSPGAFIMGADSGQGGYNLTHLTSPAHDVTLTNGFEIGKYEVTTQEFAQFLNALNVVPTDDTSSKLSAKINGKWVYYGAVKNASGAEEEISLTYSNGVWAPESSRRKLPMERVTYAGALEYCAWLTSYKNDGYTYRLPTEAEWEYAAKGGTLAGGRVYSGSDDYEEVVNYKTASSGWKSIRPIGEKYPNELGIYDMSGNLWEFVKDRSDYNWVASSGFAGYYKYCENGVTNPQGPSTNIGTFTDDVFYCIKKGGSSNEQAASSAFCPSFRRIDGENKTHHHTTGGFRVVRVTND